MKLKLNEIDTPKDNEFKIIVELDAHDDVYYQLRQGSYIVAERINNLDDLMILVREKVKRVFK